MRKFTFILGVATAISSSVFAGPILNIKFDVDGKKTFVGQEGELTPFNDFSYVGSIGDGYPSATWVVGWNLASNFAATSFVTNGFTIANLTANTKRFNITLEIPNPLPTLLCQALAEAAPLFRRPLSRRTPLQVGWAQVLVTSFNLIFQVVRPRRSVVFGAEI